MDRTAPQLALAPRVPSPPCTPTQLPCELKELQCPISQAVRAQGTLRRPEPPQASVPLAQVVTNGCLVEALSLVKELSNILARVLQQVVFDQELDALERCKRCCSGACC